MKTTPLTAVSILKEPSANYMNDAQQSFFRTLLLEQRLEQRQWQLRMLEREKKLLDKIDQALERLARDEYGWCEESGDPIGLQRLLLRPTATLSIEAKERQEQFEKHLNRA